MSSAEDRIDDALKIVFKGVSDEAHYLTWTVDQMVRALTGCPLVVRTNRYGETYQALGESKEYLDFITQYRKGESGPETYSWDIGIAP